jgi:hypothetical protein
LGYGAFPTLEIGPIMHGWIDAMDWKEEKRFALPASLDKSVEYISSNLTSDIGV